MAGDVAAQHLKIRVKRNPTVATGEVTFMGATITCDGTPAGS